MSRRAALVLACVLAASAVASSCGDDSSAPANVQPTADGGGAPAPDARPPFEVGPEDSGPGDADVPPDGGLPKIEYVFVLVKENHTFDSYFTGFPGALSSMTYTKSDGTTAMRPVAPDGPLSCDVAHAWSNALAAYDDGKMDGFSAGASCADPDTPFYRYTEPQIPNYWALARSFVLADHFFSTLLSSTTPGHFTTVAAQSPFCGNADSSKGCSLPAPDRGTVTAYNRDTCNDRGDVDACFDVPTIVDAFPKSLTWRAYGPTSGGRVATPFNFALKVGGDPAMRAHFRSQTELLADLDKGDIPNLIYANVPGPLELSEHPPAGPCGGENFTVQITNRLMKSAHWNEMAILITWDDWGGFYDHVAPALETCKHTPGFRLPLIIVSPYAKKGYVLKSVTEHASIPRFIEDVFGMPRMAARDKHARDATAGSLLDAFDFTQAPRPPLSLPIRNCP